MPRTESTSIVRNAASASLLEEEKLVSWTARLPTAKTAIRSPAGLVRTNSRAAAAASTIAWPRIDCDRSRASPTLFSLPRFVASKPITGLPFSRSAGTFFDGVGVTIVAWTVG